MDEKIAVNSDPIEYTLSIIGGKFLCLFYMKYVHRDI